jgi:tRNA(fMet)-specific endonuclease VapC
MAVVADGLLIADTDLVIDFLRGADPGASMIENWMRTERLRLTAITAFELRLGADFFARNATIESLLARRTLPLDAVAALLAGEIYADLSASGIGIGLRDAMLAGICRRFDLPLATRNRRHFERVADLRLHPAEER